MTKQETLEKLIEIISSYSEDPSEEIIKLGKCMMEVGETLKGHSLNEARGILLATEAIIQIEHGDRNDKS